MNSNSAKSVETVLELIEERGVKQAFVEGLLDGYRGKLTEWKKGKSSPTLPELKIIADYFDVSVDYLLGNTSERNTPFQVFSTGGVQLTTRVQGNISGKDAENLYKIINESFSKFISEHTK